MATSQQPEVVGAIELKRCPRCTAHWIPSDEDSQRCNHCFSPLPEPPDTPDDEERD